MKSEQATQRWSRLPETVQNAMDTYETELHRYLSGQVPEKVFLEFRLRHGVYGQRQPGVQMQRIKIPLGMLNAEKMEILADLSEEYSDGISHVTTRQDVQLHFVNILDTPEILRRLAEVGITTREACGNSVRNVTACPQSGVCCDEVFDVTPHARAMAYFLLRHPDAQNFGRKFKIAFSGCSQHPCGLARMHDIGAIARVREIDGKLESGFQVYVGGGLGAVPHQAKLFSEFVPASEMLPLAQAMSRLFAQRGEKKHRARARMKFLVSSMGIEAFREAAMEEREKLPPDPRWSSYVDEVEKGAEQPLREGSELDWNVPEVNSAFRAWHRSNVRPQRQKGYSTVTIFLPLGDINADQLRGVARISRKYCHGTVRATVAQNLLIRWISNGDLPAVYHDLEDLKLALPMGETIADLTACPGTDSCKLGIASSRGLAGVLHRYFLKDSTGGNGDGSPDFRKDISVKMSGCFNSCGQHHIANIGFFGSSKRKGSKVAPVFQVILGGDPESNACSYGLMVAKVSAHHAPAVVHALTRLYDAERKDGENFNQCMERLGKAKIRQHLQEFSEILDDEAYYHDNRQPWEYVKHVEAGECAGEVVTQAEFLLDDAERLVFDAELQLDDGKVQEAAQTAFQAMKRSADALLSAEGMLLSDKYDTVAEFKSRFIQPGRVFGGVAEYFIRAAGENLEGVSQERARQVVEEANLFTEEAHVIYGRMAGTTTK